MEATITTYFEDPKSIETMTRADLIKAMINRHAQALEPLKKEEKGLKKQQSDLDKKREAERKGRDGINSEVSDLKDQRQVLHKLANEGRREFFILMEKLDDLEKLDKEIDEYRTKLEKMEWELQTTKITSSDEKVMIKRIQEVFHQMKDANVEAQKKLGIKERLASLSQEIGERLDNAQQLHERLLGKAEESDIRHDEYVDVGRKLSEVRVLYRRVARKIKLHKECLDYWNDWVGDDHA